MSEIMAVHWKLCLLWKCSVELALGIFVHFCLPSTRPLSAVPTSTAWYPKGIELRAWALRLYPSLWCEVNVHVWRGQLAFPCAGGDCGMLDFVWAAKGVLSIALTDSVSFRRKNSVCRSFIISMWCLRCVYVTWVNEYCCKILIPWRLCLWWEELSLAYWWGLNWLYLPLWHFRNKLFSVYIMFV